MRCDVIIPVGPGHERLVDRACESVRIACVTSQGPFDMINVRRVDDTKGELGRSAARNLAVRSTPEADWVFFLDADDVMAPGAFRLMDREDPYPLNNDAVFGSIWELRADNTIAQRWQAPVQVYEDLLANNPTMSLQMGHFVRREVALDVPFDESMNTGEDFDYYLRLWRGHDCVKLDAPLFFNDRSQHSKGPRSATGAEWSLAVAELIAQARQDRREDAA